VRPATSGFVADLGRRRGDAEVFTDFAAGDTPGSAALAAYRRFVERLADPTNSPAEH